MYDKRIPSGKILGTTDEADWLNKSPLTGQTTMYPRSISLEDIDRSVYEWFKGRDILIDSNPLPVFFLTREKWGEFKQSWQYMDSGRTVNYPYITVRRSNLGLGNNPIKGRIPSKRFTTYKIPFYTPAGPTVKYYKVPQPTKVDLSYEVRVLTHYISEINLINETLLKHFASLQAYLDIDKHYMPMLIDSISDETDSDNLEDERVSHTLYSIQVRGYIIDETEFEEKLGVHNILVRIDEDVT